MFPSCVVFGQHRRLRWRRRSWRRLVLLCDLWICSSARVRLHSVLLWPTPSCHQGQLGHCTSRPFTPRQMDSIFAVSHHAFQCDPHWRLRTIGLHVFKSCLSSALLSDCFLYVSLFVVGLLARISALLRSETAGEVDCVCVRLVSSWSCPGG